MSHRENYDHSDIFLNRSQFIPEHLGPGAKAVSGVSGYMCAMIGMWERENIV